MFKRVVSGLVAASILLNSSVVFAGKGRAKNNLEFVQRNQAQQQNQAKYLNKNSPSGGFNLVPPLVLKDGPGAYLLYGLLLTAAIGSLPHPAAALPTHNSASHTNDALETTYRNSTSIHTSLSTLQPGHLGPYPAAVPQGVQLLPDTIWNRETSDLQNKRSKSKVQAPESIFANRIQESFLSTSTLRDYEAYVKSMDESLYRKLLLCSDWIPALHKTVVDVGTGSGALAHAIAEANPSWWVMGIDLSPKMIELATEKYSRPNLSYRLGNSNRLKLSDVDVFIYSSVFHEIYSFSNDSIGAIEEAIQQARSSLAPGGQILVRDFIGPSEPNRIVHLVQMKSDIKEGMSLPDFARDFSKINHRNYVYDQIEETGESITYRTTLANAYEYMYRYKDSHWEPELREKYFYWSQEDAEEVFQRNGFKILSFKKLPNENRVSALRGKIYLIDPVTNTSMDYPPDKALYLAEKI
jgi:ubiquinone/menaquinone biosynthesis C-methylase UbiE